MALAPLRAASWDFTAAMRSAGVVVVVLEVLEMEMAFCALARAPKETLEIAS